MISAVDHVQLAMPAGGEEIAVAFYEAILGLRRVGKPPHLARRGGCWFETGAVKIHLGIDPDFRPARKAHAALLVEDLPRLIGHLELAGHPVKSDQPLDGHHRVYVDDPFGNRLELLEMAIPHHHREQRGRLADTEIAHFDTFGFVLLSGAFDPGPLADEMDRCFADGLQSSFEASVGGRILAGAYLPMMCERTPVSLSLVDRFALSAAELLAAPILPVRAKGVRYFGSTDWHFDSAMSVASVGFVCYLDRLCADNGALRVLPGSHRGEFGSAVAGFIRSRRPGSPDPVAAAWVDTLPGHPVCTEPGDVIVFDEHLYHASTGGRNRRQWRVDYVADPVGAEEETNVRSYFSSIYRPDWHGGYDVDRYPTYGAHWLASGQPWVDRLAELGAYEASGREEAFARSQRP